uniref:Uncharacterized protein n=1 Tax=Mycobacterium riyadhense TaxID=486698 RepID=A0A653EZU9_9MYCO|nr:hypothetical protein BIN_B_04755 [Mycobacterium riyadhense]
MIAPGQTRTGDVQLAGYPDRHRLKSRVKHVELLVRLWRADGHGVSVGAFVSPMGDRYGRLGGPIEVVQARVARRGEGVRSL